MEGGKGPQAEGKLGPLQGSVESPEKEGRMRGETPASSLLQAWARNSVIVFCKWGNPR